MAGWIDDSWAWGDYGINEEKLAGEIAVAHQQLRVALGTVVPVQESSDRMYWSIDRATSYSVKVGYVCVVRGIEEITDDIW